MSEFKISLAKKSLDEAIADSLDPKTFIRWIFDPAGPRCQVSKIRWFCDGRVEMVAP